MLKILFVCTGNMCRSPSAELLLKKRLGEEGISGVEVASARKRGARAPRTPSRPCAGSAWTAGRTGRAR
jgi:protein-tyrosine phosphatase